MPDDEQPEFILDRDLVKQLSDPDDVTMGTGVVAQAWDCENDRAVCEYKIADGDTLDTARGIKVIRLLQCTKTPCP